MSTSIVQVFIYRSDEYLGRDVFAEENIAIGSDAAWADLCLEEDSLVLAQHAHLRRTSDGVVLVAKEGAPVLLNGKAIATAQIQPRDQIEIGSYSLQIKYVRAKSDKTSMEDPTRIAGSDFIADEATRLDACIPKSMASKAMEPDDDLDENSDAKAAAPPNIEVAEHVHQSSASSAENISCNGDNEDDDDPALGGFVGPAWFSVARTLADAGPKPRRSKGNPGSKGGKNRPQKGSGRGVVGHQPYEVMVVDDDVVLDIALLLPGERYTLDARKIGLQSGVAKNTFGKGRREVNERGPNTLLEVDKKGRLCLCLLPKLSGAVIGKTGRAPLQSKHGTSCDIKVDEVLDLKWQRFAICVRAVDPRPVKPRLISWPARWRRSGAWTVAATVSIALHLLAVIGVSQMGSASALTPSAAAPIPEDAFKEVAWDPKLELEPPAENPPAPKVEVKAKAKPKPRRRMRRRKTKPRPRPLQAAKPQSAAVQKEPKAPPAAASGMLGLLAKRGARKAPGPASVLAAASTLKAVPTSARGGFLVSGLIAQASTNDMRIGGSGGGLVRRGSRRLLRGGSGAVGTLGGKGKRSVVGMVRKMPRAMRSRGQGTLGRDAIQKVINSEVGDLQRCYEKALVGNRSLQGKVQIEWTIGARGDVRVARQAFSNLASAEAVRCMLSEVRSWRFPAPKGGEVTVSYPFVFAPVGF